MSHDTRHELVTLAERIQEGGLYLLLFLLPFSKASVSIGFGVLFLAWLWARWDPRTRARTVWADKTLRFLLIALIGYFTACALSVFVSRFHWLSVRGLIGKWGRSLLYFVVAADLGRHPGVARRGIIALACSSVFVIIEAVTQELFHRGVFLGHPYMLYGRATGPYENPIDLATFFMMVIPLVLVYAHSKRWIARLMLWSLLAALTVFFARTDALGAWLAFGIGLVAVSLSHAAIRRAALILIIGVVVAVLAVPQSTGHTKEAFSSQQEGAKDRWIIWQAALRMIRNRPLLGHGVNTFMAHYLEYRVGGEAMPRYAHNCYLQVAAETGLVGLAWFLAMLGVLFRHLFVGLRRMVSDDALLLSGYVVGLLAFVLQAAIDTNFYSLRQAALFWILAGVAFGLSRRLTLQSS